jgi:hypothetical protein
LTAETQIKKYLSTARQAIKENGVVTIGTFSENGPKKCSGLDIKQYSEEKLTKELQNGFIKIRCITEDTQHLSIQRKIFSFAHSNVIQIKPYKK